MRRFKAQFNKRPLSNEHYPCDDIREGDGVDPKLEVHPPRNISNRKALQLCSQVSSALSMAFAESTNNVVRDLQIESVLPAPDSTQLLVTVNCNGMMANDVLENLNIVSGWLRSEVAKAICRKRVPQIKYNVK